MGNVDAGDGGRFYIDYALKAAQWERAKGELRALIALQGSYASRQVGDDSVPKWERLKNYVEDFIQEVEDQGLQE
jgi:hypothetical protein